MSAFLTNKHCPFVHVLVSWVSCISALTIGEGFTPNGSSLTLQTDNYMFQNQQFVLEMTNTQFSLDCTYLEVQYSENIDCGYS